MTCRGQEVFLQVNSAETGNTGLDYALFSLYIFTQCPLKVKNGRRAVEHHVVHSMYLPSPKSECGKRR